MEHIGKVLTEHFQIFLQLKEKIRYQLQNVMQCKSFWKISYSRFPDHIYQQLNICTERGFNFHNRSISHFFFENVEHKILKNVSINKINDLTGITS